MLIESRFLINRFIVMNQNLYQNRLSLLSIIWWWRDLYYLFSSSFSLVSFYCAMYVLQTKTFSLWTETHCCLYPTFDFKFWVDNGGKLAVFPTGISFWRIPEESFGHLLNLSTGVICLICQQENFLFAGRFSATFCGHTIY